VGRKEKAIESNSEEKETSNTERDRTEKENGQGKTKKTTCGMRPQNAHANAKRTRSKASKMEDG